MAIGAEICPPLEQRVIFALINQQSENLDVLYGLLSVSLHSETLSFVQKRYRHLTWLRCAIYYRMNSIYKLFGNIKSWKSFTKLLLQLMCLCVCVCVSILFRFMIIIKVFFLFNRNDPWHQPETTVRILLHSTKTVIDETAWILSVRPSDSIWFEIQSLHTIMTEQKGQFFDTFSTIR